MSTQKRVACYNAMNMFTVLELADSRPAADHSIEQFLMTPEDLQQQIERIGDFLRGKRVFFLGDDDHVSPLLARDYGVMPVVYEYDGRVRENLSSWLGQISATDFVVREYDARQPVTIDEACDAFYINPPYSSRSEGLGVKVWLMRSLEACRPDCSGILVMPREGAGIGAEWVGDVQASVDAFIAANGLSIQGVEANVTRYADTRDAALLSSNVYLSRLDPSQTALVDPAGLYN